MLIGFSLIRMMWSDFPCAIDYVWEFPAFPVLFPPATGWVIVKYGWIEHAFEALLRILIAALGVAVFVRWNVVDDFDLD